MAKKASKAKPKAPKKGNNGVGSKAAHRKDEDLGPIEVAKIRVPINEKAYQKKESELAQLEVVVAKKKRALGPTLGEIRKLRKQIAGLTVDIENNTEEREERVRRRWDYKHNEVRIYRASDMKLIEKRPLLADERKRVLDVEDERFAAKRSPLPEAEPDLTDVPLAPAEAIAAARDAAVETDQDEVDAE